MSHSPFVKHSDVLLQAELQLIMNAVVEGVCGLDAQGNATFCNDALLSMTGHSEDEFVGKNVHTLLHHSRPDGTRYPAEECAFRKGIEAGRATHIVGEFLWRKEGTCFPTEYWMRILSQPLGRTCYVATVKDVTEIQQARDVLRRSEERFRRILASAPDIAWTAERSGRTLYVSPKVEALLGYTKQEICRGGTQLWLGRIHPEDFGRVNAAYAALFEKQTVFDAEYRIRRKDGVWIWVQDRATGTHEENGTLCAHGFLSDITRRKQAEEALHSQTAFLEAQANSTIEGYLVVDRNGQRLMQNLRLSQLFGIPAKLLADKDDQNILKYLVTLLKDPETFLAKVNYLYKHPDETSRDEIELKNGMFLDRYSSPVIDKNGIYYGRIWTFRDITERKRNADVLRQLSLVVEQSPVSVVITDPKGNISYVNRKFTECTGYRPEEVVGRNPRVLNAGRTSPELYRNLWSTITQGGEWRGEFCNQKKNGEIYWEAATIRPITNSQGAITHFLAIKEDITERRRAEKELRLTQFSVGHASDIIQWMDAQGQILYANQASCATLQRSREELLSLSIPDICPPFPKEAWDAFWEQLKARGSMTFETQLQTKQGQLFPVEVNANYLKFDGQEYCFGAARDIAERRALEAQLRQAQKLEGIGQLAAGIAHEINTPTQFVTDNLTFLRDSWKAIHALLEQYRSTIQNAGAVLPEGMAATLDEAERGCDLNFIVAQHAAHTLKGSAGLIGAPEVTEAARDLEMMAKSGKMDGLELALETLDHELKRLTAVVAGFHHSP